MTIRDPEVLEALREEPELLAVADAVSETQRPPQPWHRPAVSRAAAVAAVGVAALVAVLLWPSGGGRHGILDRALAAIGSGPILHLVVQMPVGVQLVDIHTGRTTVPTVEMETWGDREFKQFHTIMRFEGRIVGEMLYPQDGSSGMSITKVDPAYAALWTGYRKALADGSARIERAGSLYGHKVYWLTFPGLGRAPGRNEVAIDSHTYEPLDFRFHLGSRVLDQRVLLARTEPFSASAFTRRTARPNPLSGPGMGSTGTEVSPSAPAKPWLQAGPEIAGVKLSTVHETQTRSEGRTIQGFELVYGSELSMRRSVIVDEAKRPEDPLEWRHIPKGFMQIAEGETSEGSSEPGSGGGSGATASGSTYTLWTGNILVHGVYVTIQTGLGRAALLEAARALRLA